MHDRTAKSTQRPGDDNHVIIVPMGGLKSPKGTVWRIRRGRVCVITLNHARVDRSRARRRGRDKKFCITMEIDGELLNALVRHEYLSDAQSDDPKAIVKAIAKALTEAFAQKIL